MHRQNAPTKCSNFIYAPSKCINAFESEHDAFMKIRSKSENRIFHIWPKFEIFNILDYYENKILTHLRKSVFFFTVVKMVRYECPFSKGLSKSEQKALRTFRPDRQFLKILLFAVSAPYIKSLL